MLNGDHIQCAFCSGEEQSLQHLFLAALLRYLWSSILQWLSVSTAFAAEGQEHLEQFTGLLYCGKVFRMCLTSIWCASVCRVVAVES